MSWLWRDRRWRRSVSAFASSRSRSKVQHAHAARPRADNASHNPWCALVTPRRGRSWDCAAANEAGKRRSCPDAQATGVRCQLWSPLASAGSSSAIALTLADMPWRALPARRLRSCSRSKHTSSAEMPLWSGARRSKIEGQGLCGMTAKFEGRTPFAHRNAERAARRHGVTMRVLRTVRAPVAWLPQHPHRTQGTDGVTNTIATPFVPFFLNVDVEMANSYMTNTITVIMLII